MEPVFVLVFAQVPNTADAVKVHPLASKQLAEDGEATVAHSELASKLPQEGGEAAASQKHPLAARQVPEVVNVVQAAAAAHEAVTPATAGTTTVTAGTAADALTGAT